MFGMFKRKPPTAMDAFIRTIYGANPPRKSADLERSITIAHEDILFRCVPSQEVKRVAGELFRGPIPYSTHDLAVATALAFFKAPEFVPVLTECQILARLRVATWAKDGKVVKPLALSFEEVLYKLYKPQPSETREQPITNQEAERKTQNPNSSPDYTQVGKGLGRIFFEPDIWHEMSKLCEDQIVASEMAYAHVAIIRDAINRLQPRSVATQMLAGVDHYVAVAFPKPAHVTTATLAIRQYEQNVSPLTRLADVIVRRLLEPPGVTAVEIASLLGKVAEEAKALMKVSSAMQRYHEGLAGPQPSETRERPMTNQETERKIPDTPTVKDLLIARAPPWNRVAPVVIETILAAIADKGLLEAFVLQSMNAGLVARYEALGQDGDSPEVINSPEVIRAQVSQILCETGNRAIPSLAKALAAKQTDVAHKAIMLAGDTFEAAIALAKNQIVAYVGLATIYAMVNKQAECREWAQRGLVELVEMRKEFQEIYAREKAQVGGYKSAYLPAFIDDFDQQERQLRTLLASE